MRGVKWVVGSPGSVRLVSPTQSESCTLCLPPSGETVGGWPCCSGPSGQDPYGGIFEMTFQTITLISFGKSARSSSQGDGGGGGDRRADIPLAIEFLHVVNSPPL